jgi:CMP-N,N'-diacetyllegionaminic acid synthase
LINSKSVLAVIPARGGSKGLLGKNILPLAGKPLIAWTIESAIESKYIDKCIISTDDQEIADISLKYGGDVPFMRPSELATDKANSIDVITHSIEAIEEKYALIILLQPTSPLRNSFDIDNALELLENKHAGALVSMVEIRHPVEWAARISGDLHIPELVTTLSKNTRRQDFEKRYELNGAIYISISDLFTKQNSFISNHTIAYVMPKERSIDIDDEIDFKFAEYLLSNYKK